MCNEIPIRAKNGGFCIKSNPRRECRHDAKTDEFMCAYGCCPNHCHMYFMLAITYKKVQTLIKTYEYNLKSGFKNASEKEAYKLNYAIINDIRPMYYGVQMVIFCVIRMGKSAFSTVSVWFLGILLS